MENKEITTQIRWRSPVAVSALLMLIFFVVKNWVGYEIPQFDQFVSLLLAAGIAFGIFNSPTSKDSF